jgi:peptidoglycan/LPS O-acetylase OafA/YrhL
LVIVSFPNPAVDSERASLVTHANPLASGAGASLQQKRLEALTGLRFFAASAIVAHHLRGHFGLPLFSEQQLAQGVSVFFVLSGFVLTYVYPRLVTWAELRKFWRARFARVWPAHITALLLFLAVATLVPLPSYAGLSPLLANIALIHGWIPEARYFFSYNAVSWSISTEIGFYLLFPLLIRGLPDTWWWKLALTLGLAWGMVAACDLLHLPQFPGEGVISLGLLMPNPLSRLFEFTLGMCAALFWTAHFSRIHLSYVVATVLEIMALGLLIENVTIGRLLLPHDLSWPAQFWIFLSFSSSIPAALLLVLLASGQGLLSRILSVTPIVVLGEISYSIYLTHFILLYAFVTLGDSPAILPFYVGSVLAVSAIIWFAIERPARAFITRSA